MSVTTEFGTQRLLIAQAVKKRGIETEKFFKFGRGTRNLSLFTRPDFAQNRIARLKGASRVFLRFR